MFLERNLPGLADLEGLCAEKSKMLGCVFVDLFGAKFCTKVASFLPDTRFGPLFVSKTIMMPPNHPTFAALLKPISCFIIPRSFSRLFDRTGLWYSTDFDLCDTYN